VLGYIGRINQAEKTAHGRLDDERLANYTRHRRTSASWAWSRATSSELHGVTGFEQVETSAGGRAGARACASHPATPGNNAACCPSTSSCRRWWRSMFGDRRGALVAIDPRNGEVLAFVSKPTFDPNLFVDGIDAGQLAAS